MTRPAGLASYVFCLVHSSSRPSLRGVPAGVPGAGTPQILLIDKGIWAAVAHAPLERFTGDQLQTELDDIEAISRHALAHASVVEFFFRRGPVIPLKLFTVFSSDDKLRVHLANQVPRLRRLFAELRGQEEWGVRIIANETPAREPTSGRDYLRLKKRLNADRARPPRAAVKAANDALKSLGALATRSRKQEFPSGRGRPFVAGASLLVPSTRRTRVRKRAAALSVALARDGHRLELSGPWPPYHFASR